MTSRAILPALLASLWSALPDRTAQCELVDLRETPLVRRPVAAALCDAGRLLCVVNQRSGSLSVIDTDARRVTVEVKIGERLSDVAVLPDGKTVLVTDETGNELLVVRPAIDRAQVIDRLPVPRFPVTVTVSDDGRQIAVACLWSHRVALLSVNTLDVDSEVPDDDTRVDRSAVEVIRLPFAPRMQAFANNAALLRRDTIEEQAQPGEDAEAVARRLVVADAFGGQVAVIDPQSGEIESVRELPAHNIRGMAVSADGERLLVSHQVLSPLARADFGDVHWGNLMQNVVRELSLASVLDPAVDLLDGSRVIRLGEVGNGAADPAGIAEVGGTLGTHGAWPVGLEWVQALSGVGDVVIRTAGMRHRLPVGARPLDVLCDEEQHMVYVVCMHDDAVAVVDLDAVEVTSHISLGPQPAPTPRERGERLFFDGRRSHDGWLSCHSCHTDGHTNGGLTDTLGDGSYGTAKKIPSLLGVRDANPWAWNGQFRELHSQVRVSFTSTMHGEAPSVREVTDVVAFLHTLQPPPPVEKGTGTDEDQRLVEHGRRLFAGLGCAKCHVPPLTYTIDLVFDVGLQDEAGLRRFNPPSLRGVSQRTRFFHDGRAETLEAVFTDHGHQLPRDLTRNELKSLSAFLRSL